MYLFIQKKILSFPPIIFLFLFIFFPFVADAAALSVSPSSGSFEVGSRITLNIIATSNAPFNAISGVLNIPSSIFSVESVSKSGSVLNFWVTEPTKVGNTIKFEGVALGGFAGSSGSVITVNLRAVKAGSGDLSFQSGQILANDGEGTDITGNLIGGSFSVKEVETKITIPKSETKPVPVLTPKVEPTPEPEPEVLQPTPTLKAPEITLGSKYGSQAILGTSIYPKAQVLVTFVAPDGAKVFILGVADVDGSFNLLVPNSLKRGSYSVSAVMIKEDKTNSETSNSIIVIIGSIISDITEEVWVLIGLLVLAILYLLLRIYHHVGKRRNTNKDIKTEIHNAEHLIHKSFDILREDVVEYSESKLTASEQKRISEIKKDISDAEKVISKEINNIEIQ